MAVVAQLVERQIVDLAVAGSSPVGRPTRELYLEGTTPRGKINLALMILICGRIIYVSKTQQNQKASEPYPFCPKFSPNHP